MAVLLTGAAGFIGYHTAEALLDRGERVVGVDIVNDYYDVALKEARLARLTGRDGFSFYRVDIADQDAMIALVASNPDINGIIHLAAQAGVRYSLENPFAYVQSNLVGQMVILEIARHTDNLKHLVYASSSSVYGGYETPICARGFGRCTGFALRGHQAGRRVDGTLLQPSLRHSDDGSALYRLWTMGATRYGPFIFTKAILEGRPIDVFNNGEMKRDFTHVSDIVPGVLACLDRPPQGSEGVPHKLYNLGNNMPEP